MFEGANKKSKTIETSVEVGNDPVFNQSEAVSKIHQLNETDLAVVLDRDIRETESQIIALDQGLSRDNGLDLGSGKFESLDVKDHVFDEYMKQQLLEDFFESLREILDDETVNEMTNALLNFSDKEIYAAASLPYELRERKFKEFAQKIDNGELPEEVITAHMQVSNKYGFGIGYHTSPTDIRPKQNGEWTIKGTEIDHRDNDVNMAYYSTKYRHIYREKNPQYVYIVRTEPGTHKTDGIWSRAGSLSIIAKVPFVEVASYVETETKKILSENRVKNENEKAVSGY